MEPGNPLRTTETTLEDNYGTIDGIINNGRRGEELENVQAEARRTTPEKKSSIRERPEDTKREWGRGKPRTNPLRRRSPRSWRLMSRSKKWRLEWAFFLGENGRCQYNKLCKGCIHLCKQRFRTVVVYPLSLHFQKHKNQGSKWIEELPVALFLHRAVGDFHAEQQGVFA